MSAEMIAAEQVRASRSAIRRMEQSAVLMRELFAIGAIDWTWSQLADMHRRFAARFRAMLDLCKARVMEIEKRKRKDG